MQQQQQQQQNNKRNPQRTMQIVNAIKQFACDVTC